MTRRHYRDRHNWDGWRCGRRLCVRDLWRHGSYGIQCVVYPGGYGRSDRTAAHLPPDRWPENYLTYSALHAGQHKPHTLGSRLPNFAKPQPADFAEFPFYEAG